MRLWVALGSAVANSVTLLNIHTTKYGMIYDILVRVHNP